MKILFIIFILLAAYPVLSQSVVTEYFDRNNDQSPPGTSYYYSIGKKNKQGFFYDSLRSYYTASKTIKAIGIRDQFGNPIGDYIAFYPDGSVQLRGRFEKKHFKLFQTSPDSTELTIEQFYDPTGRRQVKNYNGFIRAGFDGWNMTGKITNGLRDSVWTRYDDHRKVMFHESWHEGEFVDGISFDSAGKEHYYRSILVLPEPVEGLSAFYSYVSDQINYPKEAEKRGIEGKIMVEFTVGSDGAISSPTIIQGLGFGIQDEVLRVVSLSKPWKPALERGQPIKRKVTIPFLFRLK